MSGLAVAALLLSVSAGCFSERSFPASLDLVKRIEPPPHSTVRDWTAGAARQLQPLLQANHKPALVTEQLVEADGRPLDVYKHFNTNPNRLASVFDNFYGLMHTAQCSHTTVPAHEPPPWPGFEDVWVPVNDGVRVFGRLGLAKRDGAVIRSDCIVILPGLLGDLSVDRTQRIAEALVARGLHALAIEVRGYGRTDADQPNVYYNFGVRETEDLQAVAEWLQARPDVRRTGAIGFCWGANHALLAAWDDGRRADHPSVNAALRPYLRPRDSVGPMSQRHFEAGVIAFSPVLVFEEIIERCWTPTSALVDPVLNALQDGIRERQEQKRHSPVNGSLRTLIDQEFARSKLNAPGLVEDGLDYMRFLPFKGRATGDKLESARVPVLIVHGSTDPLANVQAVADLIAMTKNPNVSAIVLEGGGHVGFAAYARDWFYSLILGYFDPETGAAKFAERQRSAE